MFVFFHIWKDMKLSEVGVLTSTLTCWWRCTKQHTSLFVASSCSMTSLVTVRPCPIVAEILLSSPSILSHAMARMWWNNIWIFIWKICCHISFSSRLSSKQFIFAATAANPYHKKLSTKLRNTRYLTHLPLYTYHSPVYKPCSWYKIVKHSI